MISDKKEFVMESENDELFIVKATFTMIPIMKSKDLGDIKQYRSSRFIAFREAVQKKNRIFHNIVQKGG